MARNITATAAAKNPDGKTGSSGGDRRRSGDGAGGNSCRCRRTWTSFCFRDSCGAIRWSWCRARRWIWKFRRTRRSCWKVTSTLGEMRTEGPFGDHTGFYSLEGQYPVFHVHVHHASQGPALPDDHRGPAAAGRLFHGPRDRAHFHAGDEECSIRKSWTWPCRPKAYFRI